MKAAEKQHLVELIEADQLQAAFEMLKEIKNDDAIASPEIENIIIHAIQDPNPLIQAAACNLINQLNEEQQKESINTIIEGAQTQALQELFYNSHHYIEHKKLRSLILDTIKSDEKENRSLGLIKAASFAIIAQNPTATNQYIKRFLEGNDESIKIGLIQALHLLPEKNSNSIISILFQSPNNKIKTSLIETLQSHNETTQDNIISKAFTDKDMTVTDAAIEEITHLESDRKKSFLSQAIKSNNLLLKLKAGQLIEQEAKNNPEEYTALKEELDQITKANTSTISTELPENFMSQKEKEINQWLETQDLGRLPSEIAKPLLYKALKDPSESKRLNAIRSVYFLPWQTASPIIEEALNDTAKSVRWEATSLLQYLPVAHALPLLAIALQDKDHYVRQQSVVSLGKNYSKVTEPLLIRSLSDKSEYVRAEAAKYIHKFSSKIKEYLTKAMNDGDGKVRSAAANALTHLDPHEFKDILNSAINSTDSKIRSGIAEGMHNFQGKALESAISFLVHDPSDVVRRKLFQNMDALQDNIEITELLINTGIKDSAAPIRLIALQHATNLEAAKMKNIQMTAAKDSEALVKAEALKALAL